MYVIPSHQMTGDYEVLTVKVSPETKQALRIAAAEEGIGMSEYVRNLIESDLEVDGSGNPKNDSAETVA